MDFVNLLNIVGSICSIVSFFVSIFIASRVYKIRIDSKSVTASNQSVSVGRDYHGGSR